MQKQWRFLLWMIPSALVAFAVLVLFAAWLRTQAGVIEFLDQYPGMTPLPANAPVGFPAWLGWQHFLNFFFLVLIVRTGWSIRSQKRPSAFWTRSNTGLIRTKGAPRRMGINVWFHLVLDALWALNGLVFIVLLFATGQWMRIVPTSWDIVPNALSALLRYASFDWPLDNGWVNYNSLQVLAYFATVFIAAPLAILTGARLSTAWPLDAPRLNRLVNERVARFTHTTVLFYFVIFTMIHVTLVLSTGALRNLNHIFAAQDAGTWVGAAIFAVALAATIAAWVLARPKLLEALASLSGTVRR